MTRITLLFAFLCGCSTSGEESSPAVNADATANSTPLQPQQPPEVAPTATEEAASAEMLEFEGKVEFISIKNGVEAVPGRIEGVRGSVGLGQEVEGVVELEGAVDIPLADLTTDLAIRDQRVRDTFFGVSQGNNARFRLTKMKRPSVDSPAFWVDGVLEIGPYSQEIRGHFLAKDKGEGVWELESGESMVAKISKLGMSDRLADLVELCMHDSIDDSVEVRVSGLVKLPVGLQ